MVHICCTARKSTEGCLTIGQLAPCGTPRQQEEPMKSHYSELVEPQQEEPAECRGF
jgi:hypothetical protein